MSRTARKMRRRGEARARRTRAANRAHRRKMLARALDYLGERLEQTPPDCVVLIMHFALARRLAAAVTSEHADDDLMIAALPRVEVAPFVAEAVEDDEREAFFAALAPHPEVVPLVVMHEGVTVGRASKLTGEVRVNAPGGSA